MGKDIDPLASFGASANCLPAPGVSVAIQPVSTASLAPADLDLDLTVPLDLDLSEGTAVLDLDLSEGPGYVDSAIKNADAQPFDPSTDRVVFQVPPGPAPQR